MPTIPASAHFCHDQVVAEYFSKRSKCDICLDNQESHMFDNPIEPRCAGQNYFLDTGIDCHYNELNLIYGRRRNQ